jgi:hypothetical protein
MLGQALAHTKCATHLILPATSCYAAVELQRSWQLMIKGGVETHGRYVTHSMLWQSCANLTAATVRRALSERCSP